LIAGSWRRAVDFGSLHAGTGACYAYDYVVGDAGGDAEVPVVVLPRPARAMFAIDGFHPAPATLGLIFKQSQPVR
jgi:hypothetical protein